MPPQPVPPVPFPPGVVTRSPSAPPLHQPVLVGVGVGVSGATTSTSLLSRVLQQRHLQCADQLFSVSDYEIITELHSALARIKLIFSNPNYLENPNDQSVVELALSRITSAIRETSCIETYAPALVDVLDSCLSHKMSVLSASGQFLDSPYCRIASELLSSLFMYHSKKSVMTVAIPVAVKVLSCANQELVRSTSSYLSLAAIHNGRLLAQYAVQVISNILNGGNYSLLRVLPQVYPENREPFHAHLSPLFRLLGPVTDTSEKLSLLQLASMVANTKPDLIIPHLGEFDEFLLSVTTCTAVLHIYLSLISMGRVSALVNQLLPLKRALRNHSPSQNTLATMGKVIGHIGRSDASLAVMAVPDLIELCHKANAQNLPILLKEIESVAEVFPNSVQNHLDIIKGLSERHGSTYSAYKRIRGLSGEKKRASTTVPDPSSGEEPQHPFLAAKPTSSASPHRSSDFQASAESLLSKRSSRILPNDPSPNAAATIFNVNENGVVVAMPKNVGELDRNMRYLADLYKMRSSGSLGHPGPSGDQERTTRLAVPQTPSVSAGQLPVLPPAIMIGKDGRVRPVSGTRHAPSSSHLQLPKPFGYETTFPVADTSPVTTTASSLNVSAKLPPKGRPRSSHSLAPSRAATESSKPASTDTVGRASRASDWVEERGDVVKQFVSHRRTKIQRYVHDLATKFPVPFKCTIERAKGAKSRMRVHFACEGHDNVYCLFEDQDKLFTFKTGVPAVWIHLMFLTAEVSSIESNDTVLSQESDEFKTLAHCWGCLPKETTKGREFVTLVTSAFPASKEQALVLKELQEARFFDSFTFDAQKRRWTCFSCTHPEKVTTLIRRDDANQPLLQGQLKEKRGKWKFLKRWHTKYFTLSSAALTCTDQTVNTISDKLISPAIDLRKIRSIKSLSRGRQSRKALPKAFEIFTEDDKSYVLKASDRSKAEEWFQYLQVAVAKAQIERRLKWPSIPSSYTSFTRDFEPKKQ